MVSADPGSTPNLEEAVLPTSPQGQRAGPTAARGSSRSNSAGTGEASTTSPVPVTASEPYGSCSPAIEDETVPRTLRGSLVSLGTLGSVKFRRSSLPVHPVVQELQVIQQKLIDEQNGVGVPWVNTTNGNMVFGVLILLNSAFIGVDIEVTGDSEQSPVIIAIESIFLVAFWVEIVLRIRANGCAAFCWDRWGPFDFACTLLGSLDAWLLTPLMGSDSALSGISVLRTLRLLRLLRLLRVFRVFKGLSKLAGILARSLTALVWLALLFLLVIYMSSVFVHTLLIDHADEDADIDRLTNSIGWTAFYHVFLITAEGYLSVWVDPTSRLSDLWIFYWAACVVALHIFMLNLTIGILVQTTLGDKKAEDEALANLAAESSQFRSTLLTLFRKNDIDEDGSLDADELDKLLDHKDMDRVLRAFNIKTDLPRSLLLTVFGLMHEPHITFQSFYETCVRICGSNKDIRSFMLQVDIATLKKGMLQCIQQVRTLLAGAQGAQAAAVPPPSQPAGSEGETLCELLARARARLAELERQQDEALAALGELRASLPAAPASSGRGALLLPTS